MEGRSGRWGCGGDSHLNSRSTSRLGHGDLRALKPQAGEENQKANCQGKTKSILCPRSSRSGLIYLGGGLPPVGNRWAGRSSGPSLGSLGTCSRCWHQLRLGLGAGSGGVGREAGAMWGLRVRKWDTRAQEHGKLRPRVQAGVLQWWGALAVSFSFVQSLM